MGTFGGRVQTVRGGRDDFLNNLVKQTGSPVWEDSTVGSTMGVNDGSVE